MKTLLLLFYFLILFTPAGFSQTNGSTAKDLVDKAKRLQKQLSLTDSQTSRLTVIFKQASDKFAKVELAAHGDITELTIKIDPLRKETINKIRVLLTAEQVIKFEKLLENLNNSADNSRMRPYTP